MDRRTDGPPQPWILGLQQAAGNRAVSSLLGSRPARRDNEEAEKAGQAISQMDDDQEEQEAGTTTEGGETTEETSQATLIGRSGTVGQVGGAVVGSAGGAVPSELASEIRNRQGSGRPLDAAVRMEMEGAFGADFSGVGVHADPAAGELNRRLGASAFTVGQDIFFGEGAYQPESEPGRQLLAHELTHVVQGGGTSASGPFTVGPVEDTHEQQADTAAAELGPAMSDERLLLDGAAAGDASGIPSYVRQVIGEAGTSVAVYRSALAEFRKSHPPATLQEARGRLAEANGHITAGGPLQEIRRMGRAGPPAPPDVATIMADATVSAAIQTAYNNSNPNVPNSPPAPTTTKVEQGGWIIWDSSANTYRIIRVGAGTRAGLAPIVGTRPSPSSPEMLVAWFHTHPNTAAEGYADGPSGPDIGYTAAEAKVPGIVKGHLGTYTIPYP